MAFRKLFIQVKDRKVSAPDVQQLAGATAGEHGPHTTLLFESDGVSREAIKEAEKLEEKTSTRIKFINIGGGE